MAGSGSAKAEFYISRLTPAVVCVSSSRDLDLFAGEKWTGKASSSHVPGISTLREKVRKGSPTTDVPAVGKGDSMDSPRNSCSIFLAKCYVLGRTGRQMARYQDIPFTP